LAEHLIRLIIDQRFSGILVIHQPSLKQRVCQ